MNKKESLLNELKERLVSAEVDKFGVFIKDDRDFPVFEEYYFKTAKGVVALACRFIESIKLDDVEGLMRDGRIHDVFWYPLRFQVFIPSKYLKEDDATVYDFRLSGCDVRMLNDHKNDLCLLEDEDGLLGALVDNFMKNN